MTVRFVGNMGDRYAGLAIDPKPVDGVKEGSIFEELDTGADYVFFAGVWYVRSTDVNIQDQVTRAFDFRMHNAINTDITLAAVPVVNSYTILLEPGHGVLSSQVLALTEHVEGVREPEIFSTKVLDVVGDTLTVDSPIPYPFSIAGADLFNLTLDMNVNGSVTPVVFGINNSLESSLDVVRIIIHITSTTSMDDGKFGGLDALTRGVVFRKRRVDGNYITYWNAKTNGSFGEVAFDKYYDDKAPAGIYGLTVRITYAGQAKHGVAIRLLPGEAIEMILQDDLTGLDSFRIMTQGHLVE